MSASNSMIKMVQIMNPWCSMSYVVLAALVASSIAYAAKASANITTDQASLLALKASINDDHQNILANNWSTATSPCEWIGVTCSAIHHRVTSLNLSDMALSGTVPPQLGNLSFLYSLDLSFNAFHGSLPPDLVRLRRLRYIRLYVNKFSGEIPPWLGLLPNLQYLNFQNNSFTGSLPASLSNASRLETLRLTYNSLEGMIPIGFGSLPNLRNLMIQANNLVGPIPSTIFNMSSLEILALSMNSLSGNLAAGICRNLPNLSILLASANQLDGEIPPSLSECSRLQILALAYNNFVGSVPREIGHLKNLQELYLGGNHLSGALPPEIGNLYNLVVLTMEHTPMSTTFPVGIFNLTALQMLSFTNNQLTGPIPREIGRLSMLQSLELGINNFTGVIPEEIANLSHLANLELHSNDLSGSIPLKIFNMSSLTIIALNRNHLSGVLPTTMGYGLPNLQILYLSGNDLNGVEPNSMLGSSQLPELSFITSLTSCKSLTHLSIADNPLNGALPKSVGQLSASLSSFKAYNSQIKGNIPDEVGNLSSLVHLSLYDNELTGTIPVTVKHLANVQIVYFDHNQLKGWIPPSFCNLQNLGLLDLSNNLLSGPIPDCLDNVTALRYLHLHSNRLTSNIPSSLWNLRDLLELRLSSNYLTGSLPLEISNLRVVTGVDLSANNLSGNVPSTIGDLQHLAYLSLAYNNLQGPIPESMGSMLSLEALDLSHNNLSGSIPKSFEKLRHLAQFNVSFNDLEGQIPSGGPFKNMTSQFFLPNGPLCGEDSNNFRVPFCGFNSGHKSRRGNKVVLYTLPVLAAVLFSLGFISLFYRSCRMKQRQSSLPGLTIEFPGRKPFFSYVELHQATEGYSKNVLLGTGSFGSVYKGTLRGGTVVAVKVFNLQIDNAFESFDTECEVLRNLRHRNLTKIISSCASEDFKALILEYMPNGSLDKWLYSENKGLDMVQRLDIMIDVAYGLDYLHHDYDVPVVHCDLKPGNVLLDESMVAHLSDFGITKLLGDGNSVSHTMTLGTFGYMAPEYGLDGLVSTRCDVYSFGILMMETFTRRKPVDDMFVEDWSLKQWIKDSMPDFLIRVADANLFSTGEEWQNEKLQCLKSIIELAINCSEEHPRERPDIKDVLVALNRIKHRLVATYSKRILQPRETFHSIYKATKKENF